LSQSIEDIDYFSVSLLQLAQRKKVCCKNYKILADRFLIRVLTERYTILCSMIVVVIAT
jgi:hypothetical protein